MGAEECDVAVVGSGFGGSTAALRLTEKGYRVVVLEAGRRFDETTLPKTSWRLRSFLWAPRLGLTGIQRLSLLRDVMILSGAGVGGGSLVYANTLYEPLAPFYADAQWGHITDWRDELAPYYDQARRMLGVVVNPTTTPADEVVRAVADEMGAGETFVPAPVGVYFGAPGVEADDPYFGGAGPRRTGCTECGECMTGCRHGAKNTLLKNYLHLAEREGAEVRELATVTAIRPRSDGRYDVTTERTGAWAHRGRRTLVAGQVVLAAGAIGTQKLLHRMRDEGILANLSTRLGELTRTNSETILGRADVPTRRRLHPRRRHHLVVPPQRPHPHRAGALRPGKQRDGDVGNRPRRRRRAVPAARLGARGHAPPNNDAAQPEHASLVRADDHRPRHADP